MSGFCLRTVVFLISGVAIFSAEKPSPDKLAELTDYVSQQRIYSVIASRDGQEFYRYLAPTLKGEEAHYLMSVTKSVLAACTAAAVEDKKIPSFQAPLGGFFPELVFAASPYRETQKKLTLEQIFMMSGIEFAHVTNPDTLSSEERERWNRFMAPEAVRLPVLLGEPTVAKPGVTFHYNDHNAMLAGAILQHAVGENAESYCARRIFDPMGFKNYEWMHADAGGYAMGGYGLRLRPLDLHNFGIMMANRGAFRGKTVLKPASVAELWRRRIATGSWEWKNYSQFFWHTYPKAPWGERIDANGWLGQRLYMFPESKVVVSVTGWLFDDEAAITEKILNDFLLPALGSEGGDPTLLKKALKKAAARAPFWNTTDKAERMVPTVNRKEPLPEKLRWP